MTVAENAPQCHTMVGTYLEGIGCSGVPLVVLLLEVARRALKLWMVFVMDLETGFTFELVNVNGLGGGGGRGTGPLREPMDSNKSFLVMSTLRIVLAALEVFQHMLDFRSSMSCLRLGWHTCGWAI